MFWITCNPPETHLDQACLIYCVGNKFGFQLGITVIIHQGVQIILSLPNMGILQPLALNQGKLGK